MHKEKMVYTEREDGLWREEDVLPGREGEKDQIRKILH